MNGHGVRMRVSEELDQLLKIPAGLVAWPCVREFPTVCGLVQSPTGPETCQQLQNPSVLQNWTHINEAHTTNVCNQNANVSIYNEK